MSQPGGPRQPDRGAAVDRAGRAHWVLGWSPSPRSPLGPHQPCYVVSPPPHFPPEKGWGPLLPSTGQQFLPPPTDAPKWSLPGPLWEACAHQPGLQAAQPTLFAGRREAGGGLGAREGGLPSWTSSVPTAPRKAREGRETAVSRGEEGGGVGEGWRRGAGSEQSQAVSRLCTPGSFSPVATGATSVGVTSPTWLVNFRG